MAFLEVVGLVFTLLLVEVDVELHYKWFPLFVVHHTDLM